MSADAELKKSLAVINRLERELEMAKRGDNDPIAIVGMACRFPGANDPRTFWRLLDEGREGRRAVPTDRWIGDAAKEGYFLDAPVDGLDDRVFRLSHDEIRSLDPQQRLLLELTWEAFEDAGIPPSSVAGSRTGVFVGIEKCDYAKVHLASGDPSRIGTYSATGVASSTAAGRLSYMFDFHGPCLSLDSACASSLVSLDLACQALRRRNADIALSAAVSLMLGAEPFIALTKMGALSPDGRCRTFDQSANGYARGEGGAVLVLERLSDALRRGDRVLALIRGVAVHHGGRSNGLTAPNVRSQVSVIEAAQRDAGITPADVTYVEAHGTGTPLGDPIEIAALAEVFGGSHDAARPLRVGSVKTNVGHLETAAGMAGLIKVILALRNERLPPHLHLRQPSAHIPWDSVPIAITTEGMSWPDGVRPRIAGVSAFGFNGTVAHAIVSDAPPVSRRGVDVDRPLHVLTISARDEAALAPAARAMANAADDATLADICFTANTGRDHFEHRAAWVIGSSSELRESHPITGETGRANRIAFLFAGQGSQYAGMGRALYETQPLFRRTIDECAEHLRGHLDVPLVDLLYGSASNRIDETHYSQPALFALEYALCELWRSWGIRPAAVLGHSVGEYVAACVAGVFTLPDALRLIAARGRLVQAHSPAGRMAVLFAGAEQVTALINGHRGQIALAALNGPQNTVVSGDAAAVQQLLDAAERSGLKSRPLAVSHAFHSPLMEPVIAPFRELVASMQLSRAALPLISNRTGTLIAPDALSHAGAWCEHFLTPVLFSRSMRTLESNGFDAVIEIGPTAALTALGPQSVEQPDRILWAPSLRKGGDDWRSMLTSLAQLHVRGAAVDWAAFDAPYARHKVSIPTYPFQRKRFWIDVPTSASSFYSEITRGFDAVRALGRKLLARAMRDVSDVLPEYARFMAWLERVHASSSEAERDDGDAGALIERIPVEHPDLAPAVRLLAVCLDAYPDVLRGKKKAVEVLFPGGSTAMLEAVYQNGRISGHFNALIARSVLEAVRAAGPGARVLEIGAGTGGASKGVLEALAGCDATYDYTDVSAAFTRQAKERWGAKFPFANFRVLDIEKDLAPQQFEPAQYDVVIASNVLHATRSMSRTLANTARLLKPGGALVINEITQLHEFLGMTFGLTPGWWLYEDTDLRIEHSPVLGPESWKTALAREGLAMTSVLGIEGDDMTNPLQAVMIARREEVAQPTDVIDRLTALIERVSGITIAPRDRTANLFALGLDSLILMQLKQAIEQELGVEVSMGQFYEETSTLELLAAYVDGLQHPSPRERGEGPGVRGAQPEALTQSQHLFLDALILRYNARTAKSKSRMAESRAYLADWIATIGFQPELKELIYPIVSSRSDGSAMWDVDGNRYVDLAMGFGVGFFGHQPPFVRDAIRAQLDEGYELATQSDLAAATARLVCELTGCERVAFSNTGTEAVMTAFRLARTVTRKDRVVYFKGSFHGSYDGVLAYAGPTPAARGILQHQVDDVLVLEYGAEESLRVIEAQAETIAGVLVEPVQSRNPDLQPRDFLHELRRITAERNIALIFDEMITGFRVHSGGAQAHFGVRADLVTYGKILGAGMPISAIAGKALYLDALDGGAWNYGDASRPAAATTFFGGTYCKHPLALAAARAGLQFMKEQGPELQASLNRRTADFAARLNALFRDEDVPLRVAWFASQFQLRIATRTGETFQSFELALLFFLLLEKGIYTWERRVCFLSIAHTEADLELVFNAMQESLHEMKAAGFFGHDPAKVIPLTAGQRELLFFASQSEAASGAYTEELVLELDGDLDRERFTEALNAVVARHEALRAIKIDQDGMTIAPRLDVGRVLNPPGGLEKPPYIVSLDGRRLTLVFNHIIADGWSIGVFVEELARLYSGDTLPAATPFSEYVTWSSARPQRALGTSSARTLALPTDFPRPPRRGHRGNRIRVTIPAAPLAAFCRERQASSFMVLLGAFEALLRRLARMNEIVAGVPSSGHAAFGAERMIGQCSAIVPLVVRFDDDTTFASLLRTLKRDLLQMFEHPDLPQHELRATFNQDRVPPRLAFGGIEARVLPTDVSFVKYDLSLNAMEVGGEVLLDFDYDSELFARATVEAWAAEYIELLNRCIAEPDASLGALPAPEEEEFWCGTHRVHPRRIEALLESHPYVRRASVAIDEQALVARIDGDGCDAADLRRFLAANLPPYLVPSKFSIDGGAWDAGTPRPPADATEAELLSIFSGVLALATIGVHDDFFLLGGQSIQAVQIVMRIERAFGVRLALHELFVHRTIASLARRIARTSANSEPIPALAPSPRSEASHAQRRLWFIGQIEGQEAANNLPGAYVFEGRIDADALRHAFGELIRRHEILRTTFVQREGVLEQVIHHDIAFELFIEPSECGGHAAALEEETHRRFDLERGPLLFARLLRSASQDVLVYNIHHIICDGWSQAVMIRELMAAYEGATLPAPRIQYRDYVAWHVGQALSLSGQPERLSYVERLRDLPRLDLPLDFPRPAMPSSLGHRLRFHLDADTTRALRTLANDRGATLFMVCIALVKTLLHRYTRAEEIVVGTPVAGREHPDLDEQIGCYVNTLVLRDRIDRNAAFTEILDRVRATVLEAFEHQDYPFDLLVDDLGVARDLARSPLFDVLVTMQNNERAPFVLGGIEGRAVEPDVTVTPFDLSLDFTEEGEELAVVVEYDSEIFSRARMTRLGGHLAKLARAVSAPVIPSVVEGPARAGVRGARRHTPGSLDYARDDISAIDLLLDEEHRALASFNETAMPFAADKTLFELFEEQVVRTPDAIAVVYEERSLTYAQLHSRALALAHGLGDMRGRFVALPLPRSEWPVIGLLGVLAAGGAYVPLDPDQPAGRIEHGCDVIIGMDEIEAFTREPADFTPIRTSPNDLAYVIYTSGTTGTPKGVMIEQRSVVNMIAWMEREIYAPHGPALREAMLAPFVFDTSVQQIFGSLFRGNTLHIVSAEVRNDPRALSDYFRRHAIEIVEFTPSLLLHALKEGLDDDGWCMKQICVGAEVFPRQLVDAFYAKESRRRIRLTNLYGPTECCANATYHHITFDEAATIPIGRPLGNTHAFICDENMRLVPLGVIGELCIGGEGLARGYRTDEQTTSARFVDTPHGRLYRTGDLGRWRDDGELELAGRNDEQAKIRGVRVDPIEIENRLLAHDSVTQAAVVARNIGGATELVAYFAGRDASVARLREHLRETLPEAMVPAIFVELADLPRTPGGKVDKRALPMPSADLVRRSTPFREPRDEADAKLLAIWREVLPVERIGVDDSFFELGGNSLRAVQLCARIREATGVELRLRDFFAHPTIGALADKLRACPTYDKLSACHPLGLSAGQKRLWLTDRVIADRAIYNMAGAIAFDNAIDAQQLRDALTTLLHRHESLRTCFVEVDGEPRPKVLGDVALPFAVELANDEDEARRRMFDDAATPFDLAVAPLWRARLFVLDRDRSLFFVNLHHIISDGASVDIFLRELRAAYAGETLPPLPVIPSVVEGPGGPGGAPPSHPGPSTTLGMTGPHIIELPSDRHRPAAKSHRGATIRHAFDPRLAARLQELPASLAVTQFPLLFALAAIVISRYTGDDDVVLGTAVSGRRHTALESQIGFFVDTPAIPARIDAAEPFRALVARVAETVAEAFDEASGAECNVVVTLDDETPGVEEIARGSHFDLLLSFVRCESGLGLDVEYDTDLFDAWRIEQLIAHVETLAASAVADPNTPVRDLEMLAPEERQRLLVTFNDTASEYPQQRVDELFREVAQRHADSIAVVHGDRAITYAELDRMSDDIASRHAAEALVAVRMERSIEMVATLLGILKAGAAYVPIDPAYPQARIDAMEAAICGTCPRSLAYVMFTSGSEGKPKGVEVEHRAIVRLVRNTNYIDLGPDDAILQTGALSFDASTLEIWGALLNGARLVLASRHELLDVRRMRELIARQRITTMWLTTSLFNQFADADVAMFAPLRHLLVGGERLSPHHIAMLRKAHPSLRISNGYGPTENTTFSTVHAIGDCDGVSDIPIGRPISNSRVYILGAHDTIAPIGVPGEICVAGDGLARGYLANDELTRQRFVEHPCIPGERIYRTGDIGQWLPDGTVAYLGRRDAQVKLRGVRIELGDLEAAALSQPGVRECAVIVVDDALIAFVIGDATNLRSHLATLLPAAMMPARIVVLERLPLDPNGKLDRAALLAMPIDEPATERRAPSNEIESALLTIWQSLLGTEDIGVDDDFFERGGHSLAALRMVNRIREELTGGIDIRDVFAAPTIAGLASRIVSVMMRERRERAAAWPPHSEETGDDGALTASQRRVWLQQQLDEAPAAYNVFAAFTLEGAIDGEALHRALRVLVARHEMLRSTIVVRDGEPRRRVRDDLDLEWIERAFAEGDVRAEANRPFDLTTGLPIRAQLLRIDDARAVFIINIHHIAADEWSMQILQDELARVYRGETLPPLPPLAKRGADVSSAQYWREKLAELPAARPSRARRGRTITTTIAADALRALARSKRTTLFTVFAALIKVLLHRTTEQDDIVIGTPVAARDQQVGFFANTVVLRDRVSGDDTFDELLERVRTTVTGALEHPEIPSELRVAFEVMLAFEEHAPAFALDGLRVTPIDCHPDFAKFDLMFIVRDQELAIEFATDLFTDARIERMHAQVGALCRDVAANPHARIRDLNILGDEERRRILIDFAGTRAPYPQDCALVDLFEAQVERTPDAMATDTLTYRQLDEKANAIGAELRPNERVGIALPRTEMLIATILGVLKAGAAYVPVDLADPLERRRAIFEDAGCGTVMDERGTTSQVVTPHKDNLRGCPTYVIYTSGSTGKPKGVMIEHRSVVNLVHGLWREIYARYDGPQNVALIASQAFDASVQQIFAALLGGHRLHVVDEETKRDGRLLIRFLREHAITISDATPSLLALLLESGLAEARGLALRHLIVGGEALRSEHVAPLRGIAVTNVYGPTECTVDATFHHVIDPNDIPIGRPFPNVEVYILDAHCNPVPIGVPGEICIGGDGLARGYASGDASRFIDHPFRAGERLYRTGDYGRWREDGAIDYLGRRDDQVKIRGQRVELGEIEQALASAPGVRRGAVRASGESIVAYIAGDRVDVAELRAHLAAKLPAVMVPSSFAIVSGELPLTTSGKIDRAALASIEAQPVAARAFDPPREGVEETIANIWREVLGARQFGRDDDFFDAGGHSLTAARVLARIESSLGVEIRLRAFFDAPTIAALAQLAAAPPSPPRAGEKVPQADEGAMPTTYPLTHAQRRLWVLDQIHEGSLAHSMPSAFLLQGAVDEEALRRAFCGMLERHESLRTVIVVDNGEPRQKVLRVAEPAFTIEDANEAEIRELALRDAAIPFDLANGPLLRARLLRFGEQRSALLFNVHHIISDGISLDVFVRELAALYRGESLPPLRLQYHDFAAREEERLAQPRAQRDRAYWLEQMRGPLPALSLPADFPRPPLQSHRGDSLAVTIEPAVANALRRMARAHGASLFMLALALFETLLHRYTGDEELVVGIPVAGRTDPDSLEQIGLFAETVPARTRLSAVMPFDELLANVRGTFLEALDHSAYPLDRLVDDLKIARDASRSPLFDVLFVWHDGDASRHLGGSMEIEPLELPVASVGFDLNVAMAELGDALSLNIRYSVDLFRRERIERMAAHFVELARSVVRDEHAPLAALEIVPAREREVLLAIGNVHTVAPPPGETVIELFERRVAEMPDAIAVECDGRRMTWSELNARGNGLARRLITQCGVRPEDRVAVQMRRSEWLVVAIVGILKAGAAYVPVEPSLPEARRSMMIADSAAVAVLVDENVIDAAPDPSNLPILVKPENAAYVLYTSGSTGQPKGAILEHRNVTAFAREIALATSFHPDDSIYAVASIAFDVSIQELFCPLMQGLRIVVASDDAMYDPARMLDDLARSGATLMKATPTRLRMLFDEARDRRPGVLRVVTAGGEPLPRDLHDRIAAIDGLELFVTYGPTEATVSVTTARLGTGVLSIGRPLAHASILILSPDGRLQPFGVPGEICIGGAAVGRCYLNNDELTAERYVVNPLRPGERMYRTGDIGRWLDGGLVEFLGRNDRQVKIRGQRIEPGEVETAVASHPAVRRCAVVPRMIGGALELVAYIEGDAHDPHELRQFLARRLPSAAIPAAVVMVEQWPLGATGKLDTRALPDPDPSLPRDTTPPADALEAKILAIWEEVLGRNGIGVTDDFFEAGGHSLRAASVAARAGIKLAQLMLHPTVRGQAALLRASVVIPSVVEGPGGLGGAPHVPPRSLASARDDGGYELSPAQRRLWVLSQIETASRAYHLEYAQLLEGPLDVAALERAFRSLIARHESLRTIFVVDDSGVPRQRVTEFDFHFETEEDDRPFDLAKGPLLRARLLRLAPERHVLFVTMHHIVSDWWSTGVLARELGALYRGETLAPLPIQYKDYAAWRNDFLRSPEGEAQREYWLEVLSGELPRLDLPADFSRPRVQSFRGATLDFTIGRELLAELRAFGHARGATLFTVLYAATNVLLHRYSGAVDIIVGTPVAGRELPELEWQIGVYFNTLALRTSVAPGAGFDAALEAAKQTIAGALEHQAFPFDDLVAQLPLDRDLGRTPLFDVLVVMQNRGASRLALDGIRTSAYETASAISRFDLTFGFIEEEERLDGSIEFSTDLFTRERIEAMAAHFVNLLRAAIASPQQPIAELPMMSAAEVERVVREFNRDADRSASDATIAELFEQQVARHPSKIAVTCGDRALTYAELDARANAFARELGDVRGRVVPLEMPRSEEYVAKLFGVLKAGGAFLPLNPSTPAQRREFMLRDCSDCDAAGLAYVIYTSGSTGQPKGVMIEQRNVVALARNLFDAFRLDQSDVLFNSAAFSFDMSIVDVLAAFLCGLTVTIASDDEVADPERFLAALRRGGASVMQATPTRLAMLLQHGFDAPSLRTIIVGGEALPPDLAATLVAMNGVRILHAYGPTETTVWSTLHVGQAESLSDVGRPLPGEAVLIVSPAGQPQPVGVPGELVITGAGVGRGYLNRPELTAERFAPHPLRPHERAYRTGDYGRWRADGTIEFLGRRDGQVKIRGHRLELGEIEAALTSHDDVSLAAATVIDGELVAYVAGSASEATLRGHLASRLPAYAMPSHIVILDEMPLLPSGKIDRKSLNVGRVLQPDQAGQRTRPTWDAVEAAIAQIYEEILARPVDVTDDFFAVGGHSLRAVQVANRVRQQLGADIGLRDVFEHPTVRRLAAHVRDRRSGARLTLRPAPPAPHYPLSHAQRRLFAVQESHAYDIGGSYLLTGPLDASALEAALRKLIARHETLRTSFQIIDGEPRQVIHASASPLFRASVQSLGDERHVLDFNMHHIIGDGWSLDILLTELEALYRGESLDPPALQYKDFAVWEQELERSGAWERSRAFWLERLSGDVPRIELPADRPRPAVRSDRGGIVPFALDDALAARVAAMNRRHGVTTFMTFVAACSALVHRLTGERDMILGSVTSGRDHAELEREAGCFVNLIPLRIGVDPVSPFRALLADVRSSVLDSLQHASYPFDRLVAERRSALFDVGVSWNGNAHVARGHFAECTLTAFGDAHTTAKYDLLVVAGESEEGITGAIEYSSDLFDRDTVETFARQLLMLIEQVADDDERSIVDVDLGDEPAMPEVLPVQIHLDLRNEAHEIETR